MMTLKNLYDSWLTRNSEFKIAATETGRNHIFGHILTFMTIRYYYYDVCM